MVKKRNLPLLLSFSALLVCILPHWRLKDWCGRGNPAVTWFVASANQLHSAFLIPHFTFRIPQFRILPIASVVTSVKPPFRPYVFLRALHIVNKQLRSKISRFYVDYLLAQSRRHQHTNQYPPSTNPPFCNETFPSCHFCFVTDIDEKIFFSHESKNANYERQVPIARYDTIRYREFNVDWKAEYSALSSTRSQKKKLKQPKPVPL